LSTLVKDGPKTQNFCSVIHFQLFIILQETLEDIDKDKDGKLSLDEYIGTFVLCTITPFLKLDFLFA